MNENELILTPEQREQFENAGYAVELVEPRVSRFFARYIVKPTQTF